MTTKLNPYLNFAGDCREAMEFYRDVLGGDLEVHTFGESGAPAEFNPDGVMHASLETPLGFTIMASDLPPGMEFTPGGGQITISVSGDDAAALQGYWDKLSADGTVWVPLQTQSWGDTFGNCADKFGVPWMVNIVGSPSGG
ncbi:MAG: VOC family protein [Actinobacteria bacterium]|nr:VOC family protein [Actinomycetota bacterium]